MIPKEEVEKIYLKSDSGFGSIHIILNIKK